jgi:dihydrofolate synthase/folylpolyglutamate synthase
LLTDVPTRRASERPRTLGDWLAYQERLHPRSIELGLERVREVAARLGLLQPRAKTLTVAGTNAKGSSATLLSEIYRAAGYRVGLYTSPHLSRYNERIAIDGRLADDAALCAAFEQIESARRAIPLTYFEFGTLAALLLFRDARVDVQVLEVGLGGRLDAVNIIDADAALITNIGLDHTDWLGHDRETIGREKAGVLRARRPAVCVDPEPPATIEAIVRELDAPLAQLDRDYGYAIDDGSWRWRYRGRSIEALPLPGLPGSTQVRNAAGVLTLVAILQSILPVAESAIRDALPRLRLPGRFERRGRVILDVAHNVEAAEVLVQNLREARITGGVRLVLGMLADKPVESVARVLAPTATRTYLAGLPPPRGLSAAQLAQRASVLGGEVFADVASAIAKALGDAAADETVLVCGSFLTVAEAARLLDG